MPSHRFEPRSSEGPHAEAKEQAARRPTHASRDLFLQPSLERPLDPVDVQAGRGIGLIDPHGDLAHALLTRYPPPPHSSTDTHHHTPCEDGGAAVRLLQPNRRAHGDVRMGCSGQPERASPGPLKATPGRQSRSQQRRVCEGMGHGCGVQRDLSARLMWLWVCRRAALAGNAGPDLARQTLMREGAAAAGDAYATRTTAPGSAADGPALRVSQERLALRASLPTRLGTCRGDGHASGASAARHVQFRGLRQTRGSKRPAAGILRERRRWLRG